MASEAKTATIGSARRRADERSVAAVAPGETVGETAGRAPHAGTAAAVLWTVAGPDAGRELTLVTGTHVVGRVAGVDVALDDPTVAGRQAILTVAARGAVSVTDLSAPRPTRVDGAVAVGPTSVRPGQRMTMGATTIVAGREPPANRPGATGWSDDVVDVRAVAVPAATDTAPTWRARLVGQRADRARAGAARDRFAAGLAAHQAAVAEALRRDALELPVAVRAATTGGRLWSADRVAFVAVVGRGDRWQPPPVDTRRGPLPDEWWSLVDAAALLRDVPVAVDLGPGSVVGVVGPPAFARPLARSLVLQLAVAHGPAALAVDQVLRPASPERWWLMALPHARVDVHHRHRVNVIDDHPTAVLDPSGAALVLAETAAALPICCPVVIEARTDGSAVVRGSDGGELGDHVAAAGASLGTAREVVTALTRRARSDRGVSGLGD